MTMRWGIIGCGDVVWKRVADAIRNEPNSELVAACRRDAAQLERFCRHFDVRLPFNDGERLIESEEVDAVYIATPVDSHHRLTLHAATFGKHVLVEKPMAISTAECEDMVAACKAADVRLGVAYYRRFYPASKKIEEVIQAGELGQIYSVTAVTATPPFPADFEGIWRVDMEKAGGGSLMDIGSHRLNLFLHWFGPIVEVKAFCDTLGQDHAAENCTSFICRFQSGVHGVLQCIFGSPVDPDELTIVGSAGRLTCTPLNGGHVEIQKAGQQEQFRLPPSENFNAPLIADFVAAIRENRAPEISGEEGAAVNEVMYRAYNNANQNII
ncbi:MAG: putative dehydrogenase [Pirellulaceae bacterium]|jgi:predicted dehydrogenase